MFKICKYLKIKNEISNIVLVINISDLQCLENPVMDVL